MKTQTANKVTAGGGFKFVLENGRIVLKSDAIGLGFMDKNEQPKAEKPASMAARYYPSSTKSKKPTGFQAAIPNYIQQKVNRR